MSFSSGTIEYGGTWEVDRFPSDDLIEVIFRDAEDEGFLFAFTADQARDLIEAIHNAIIEIQEEK